MKRILETMLFALALLFASPASANTDGGKAISPGKLPQAALQTINTHLPGRKIAIAKVESELFSKSYTVIFTNGEKIEFDGRGRWTEVKCKRSAVPASLVPAQIAQYIRANYPDCRILEIERDDEYEVKLSNHVEVTFNKKFEVIDID
ncbi:putative periplasmic protein [Prevotella sp. CAG:1058]|nr:putative periplasmic protein [Prevotella sp. CAG:1058]